MFAIGGVGAQKEMAVKILKSLKEKIKAKEIKVILVSGATGGIGSELVKQLSSKNCKLSIIGRNEKSLEKICSDVKKNGLDCIYQICDITDKKNVENVVKKTFEHYGRIDIAILSTGMIKPNPIETFNSEIIIKTVEVNFFGDLYFLENLLPIMMKQKKGTIAVVSTLPDKRGAPGWGAYGSSRMCISEPHPLICQGVNIPGIYFRVLVITTQITNSHVVGQNIDNVWKLILALSSG